jgi:ABC-type antimicrobial peptide transport system permease subunit
MADDNEKTPRVLIVDQTAANRYWPGQDALGKRLSIWGHLFTVVGVVRNSKHAFMSERPEPMIYMSYFQEADNESIVQVKMRGNPSDLAPAVEHAIHEIDEQLPVFDVRTMRETTQMANIFAVMQSTLAGMFAVVALILAATGIYGVVAYRTELRTHEIGIRVALGAARADVLRLVLQQGIRLTAMGLVLGLVLAFVLTRFTRGASLWSVGDRSTDGCVRHGSSRRHLYFGELPAGAQSAGCRSGNRDSRTIETGPRTGPVSLPQSTGIEGLTCFRRGWPEG